MTLSMTIDVLSHPGYTSIVTYRHIALTITVTDQTL